MGRWEQPGRRDYSAPGPSPKKFISMVTPLGSSTKIWLRLKSLMKFSFDFTPNFMIGAIYFDGQQEDIGTDLMRVGLDFNLDLDNLHFVGLVMDAEESVDGFDENNTTQQSRG